MTAILTITFILLAAFFKAVSDTLTHHFGQSVFKGLDPRFWDASVSWQYAHYLKFTKYKIDGWHLANSGMIVCFCLAIVTNSRVGFLLPWYYEVLIAGTVFNLSFNLFYNKILKNGR